MPPNNFTVPDEIVFEHNHRIQERLDEALRNIVEVQRDGLKLSFSTGLNTRKRPKMEYNTLETWFVEQALEIAPTMAVGEAYAEGGVPGVRHFVLERKAEQIGIENESRDDWIASFNEATMEWPHEARAYMAAYEFRFADRPNSTYNDKTEQFASAVGVEDYETMQSTIDCYYGDNPFTDDELSTAEASAVLYLRANDEDETVISEIENAENFIGWYKETGDVEASIRACQFDSTIPEEIAPRLAAPEDWDTLDPANIETQNCTRCGEQLHHIHHHNEGETWIGERSGTVGIAQVGPESEFITDETGVLCGSCQNEWENNANIVSGITNGNVYRVGEANGLVRDYGKNDDSVFSPIESLSDEGQRKLEMACSSCPDDYFSLNPTSRAMASRSDQHEAMKLAHENMDDYFDSGPVIIRRQPHFDDDRYTLLLPRSLPEVARTGKEFLDNAAEVIA